MVLRSREPLERTLESCAAPDFGANIRACSAAARAHLVSFAG
jgi:hypothetical protein